MRRKKSFTATIIRFILILALVLIIVLLGLENADLKQKLENINILSINENGIVANTGITFELSNRKLLITPNFVDQFAAYSSPFKDGKSFEKLIDEYVRNPRQDLYGAPRRTGDCKRIHTAIDFFVPENTPVYPLQDFGVVVDVSDNPNHLVDTICWRDGKKDTIKVEYGKIVEILYPEGISSLYAHLNEVYVKQGQRVGRNTKVGLTGYTGNIAGSGKPSHLHMELKDNNGNTFDPEHRVFYNKINYKYFLQKIKLRKNNQ